MLSVSNYHYIRPLFDTKYPSIFGLTPDVFRKQLLLFKDKGDFLHPNELLSNHEAILQSSDNYWLVTFDDGLKEQFDYALPELDALDIPAIFFANSINCKEDKVTTVHKIHLIRSVLASAVILKLLSDYGIEPLAEAEKSHAQSIYRYDTQEDAALKYLLNFRMSFDLQEIIIQTIFEQYFNEMEILKSLYMDENQLKQLANKQYLGSHTHHHYPIGLLPSEKIKFELEHSKKFLETLTHAEISMVSYPYGTPEACSSEVAQQAKRAGYTLGFTTARGENHANADLMLLNRFDCNDLIGGKNCKP